jgi:poly-gamma-glutamate capsule biosynthesis protein CapA/YwtB (metallophosphatase superfamily)
MHIHGSSLEKLVLLVLLIWLGGGGSEASDRAKGPWVLSAPADGTLSSAEDAMPDPNPGSSLALPFSPALTGDLTAPLSFPSPQPPFLSSGELPPLRLTDIFPPRDLSTLGVDPSRLRVLLATGDVIPARGTDRTIRKQKDDFSYPLRATKDLLANVDLTVINLEAPLIKGCPFRSTSRFKFCGRPGFVAALRCAGVDIVTLENNHIANYGRAAIAETIKHLEAANMTWVDRKMPAVREVRGLQFGFLAFNGVGEAIDRLTMAARIKALRPQVDILTVAFHWGAEYVLLPQAAPGIASDDPVEIAHLAVEAGADLIVGNHPHQVQAVEIYQGKLIAYSHGNFIFDQMWSYGTRVGVLGRYTFDDRILVKAEFLPVLIENYAQPVPLEGEEAEAVLDQMKTASYQLARKLATNQPVRSELPGH